MTGSATEIRLVRQLRCVKFRVEMAVQQSMGSMVDLRDVQHVTSTI
jgi:hypothetical protein